MRDTGLEDALEALVDKASVVRVLEALAYVCDGKAEHLQGNWQDRRAADEWERAARRLDRA
jgi:hypothetical protein